MKFIIRLLHLFDNKKQREYVSEIDNFLLDFDQDYPAKSESQKKEILKHRNIYAKKKYLDDLI